ncbi:hypothetical protein EOL70_14875 [Leucothrix sargassi]|nr:hypothetical protein EOL70_14875 [Leucothrix sargassi]
MLFSRRDTLVEPSFTERFSNKLGEYLTPSKPRTIKQTKSKPALSTDACYALLGENTDEEPLQLTDIYTQLDKIAQRYHKKTGTTIQVEQIALAVIKHDTQRQAVLLRKKFFNQELAECTLLSHEHTSTLRLAMIADELGMTRFSDTTVQSSVPEFKACRHMLNVLLSDVSMQDIEGYCRDLCQSCSEVMNDRGADSDTLQSEWQLRLRYESSENSLLLKCMPLDMLRDTFQRQYKKKFGQANPNQDILLESLEVTVHSEDEALAPTDSPEAKRLMGNWQQQETASDVNWVKTAQSNTADDKLAYLDCAVLDKLLAPRLEAVNDSKVSELFIQKVQKDVDGNNIRN